MSALSGLRFPGMTAPAQASPTPAPTPAAAATSAAPGVGAPQIGGALPWGNGGGNFDFTGNPANLGSNYQTAYNDALAQNQANYQNILAGYQQTAANQTTAQQAIGSGYTGVYNNLVGQNNATQAGYGNTLGNLTGANNATQAGYGQLQQNVLGTIQGIGASQQQAINDAYAAQQGAAASSLADRGLGNTTVANSVQRGLSLDQQKANIALANQMAQLTAGYQSNLGLAGLNFQNQAALQQAGQANLGSAYSNTAAMQQAGQGNLGLSFQQQAAGANTALAQNQLGWMNSINAQYPNAGLYAQLAQQYGATQQANADRALQQQNAQNLLGLASRQPGNPPGSGGGYVPSGGGFTQPQGSGGYGFQTGGGGGGYSTAALGAAPQGFGGSQYVGQTPAPDWTQMDPTQLLTNDEAQMQDTSGLAGTFDAFGLGGLYASAGVPSYGGGDFSGFGDFSGALGAF